MKRTTLAQYPAHTAGAARPCSIVMAGSGWRSDKGRFGNAGAKPTATNHITRRLSEPPT